MHSQIPARKRPIHLPSVKLPGVSTITFITICTDKRRRLLTRPEVFRLLLDAWAEADHWLVGKFVILPDHLHLFAAPAAPVSSPLSKWIQYWKARVSLRWPWPNEQPIWQASYWDRQLRSGEHYGSRWDYVRNNPVRHRLIENAEAWPWQGEGHEFRFRDSATR